MGVSLKVLDVESRDFGWLVGILEGEGSFILVKKGGYVYAQVQMVSTDEDVVRRVYHICGAGTVNGPHLKKNPKHKPQWTWRLSSTKAMDLMALLEPHMSARRMARIKGIRVTVQADRARAHEAWARGGALTYAANLNTPQARSKNRAATAARVGYRHSPESRAKISAATRKRGPIDPTHQPRGVKCGSAKLNEEIVRLMRVRYAEGESLAALGRAYGVDPMTVRGAVVRRTWIHVE